MDLLINNAASIDEVPILAVTASAVEVGLASKLLYSSERSASVQPVLMGSTPRNSYVEKLQLRNQMQEAMISMERSLGRNQFVYADLSDPRIDSLKAVPIRILKEYSFRKKSPPPPPIESDQSPKLKKQDPLVSDNQRYVEQEIEFIQQENLSKQVVIKFIKGQLSNGKLSRHSRSLRQDNTEVQSFSIGPLQKSLEVRRGSKRKLVKPTSRHSRAHSSEISPKDAASKLNELLGKSILPIKDSGISAMERRRLRMQEYLSDRREIEEWIVRDRQLHKKDQPRPAAGKLSNLEKYAMDFSEYLSNQSARKMNRHIQHQIENRQKGSALDRFQQDALKETKFSERTRRRLVQDFANVRKQINKFT